MKKKIFSLISSLAILFALIPNAFADTYINSAFVGKYLTAGATTSNYGELNILTCDSNSITVDFKFVKNDNQQLIYTCYEGTMSDDKGEVPFTVSYADGRFVANGVMDITLTDWCVKISCDSDRQHLFDGTMKPQFTLNPYGTPSGDTQQTPPSSMSSDVSVVLNGEKMTFKNGVSPVIINDSTYVPLRSVFDKMGINVYWDQYQKSDILNAQSITCTKNDTIVQFMRTFNDSGSNVWTLTKWVGENTDSSNYTRINITDLQPTIIGESSYIPLRVVSESFGADVGWVNEERTVEINCDTSNDYKYDSELIGKIEDFSQEVASSYITDDFRSVKAYPTPYFSPQAKFYKYSALDTWGEVNLHIFYGGYVEVYPLTDNSADTEPVITQTEENAESDADDLNDAPVATPETESTDSEGVTENNSEQETVQEQ